MAYDPMPASPAPSSSNNQAVKIGLGVVLGCVVLCGCLGTVLLVVLMFVQPMAQQ